MWILDRELIQQSGRSTRESELVKNLSDAGSVKVLERIIARKTFL